MRKRYPKYKPTNIPWLKEAPEEWEVLRYKYLFKEINDRSEKGEEELLSVSQYTGVTVRKDKLEDERDNLTNASSLEGYKRVDKNDLVINIMLAWNGSLGVSDYNGIVSPAYCVYKGNSQVFSKYFHYLLRTDFSKNDFKKVSTGVVDSRLRMYSDDFFSIYTILPPLPDQRAIAAFLDHKCALIDTFIQKKTRLIELLKEQKQALINRAVTRGLDPEAPLKPSGIEWLGDIPEGWEVKKVKYVITSLASGGTPSMEKKEFWDGNIPWISPKDMKYAEIFDSEIKVTHLAVEKTSVKLIPANSILMVVRSGILQRTLPIAINRVSVTINQDLKAITLNNTIMFEYFIGIIRGIENELLNACRKVVATVDSIEIPYLLDFMIPVPSLEDQKKLLDYIKREEANIDLVISRITREIDLIKEYKSALIAEAVTGGIDVRGWRNKDEAG